MKQVQLDDYTNKLLNEMVDKRKSVNNLVNTKKGIISALVMAAHRKECKKQSS